MEYIKISCISGNEYSAYKLNHHSELPKNSVLHHCGNELKDGVIGKSFSVYRKYMKKGNKTYIIFSKYF